MTEAISNNPPRSLTERGWAYLLSGQWKLRRRIRFFRLQLAKSRHKVLFLQAQIRTITAQKDREITRQAELVELWRNKCEIVQAETVDQISQMVKLTGIRFATGAVDDEIQERNFRPFKEKQRQTQDESEPFKKLRDTLDISGQDIYDQKYQNHVKMGVDAGADMNEINRTWEQHEAEEVAEIDGRNLTNYS